MITLFGFTLNIAQAFETTWIQLVAFYVSSRLLLSSPQNHSGDLSEEMSLLWCWPGPLAAKLCCQAVQISPFERNREHQNPWGPILSSVIFHFPKILDFTELSSI